MAYTRLSGYYGAMPMGALPSTVTVPVPALDPSAQGAAPPLPPGVTALLMAQPPVGPPANATPIAPGIFIDMHKGDLWYNAIRIAILPGLLSALAIKLIMFGGNYAAGKAKQKLFGKKTA